MFLTSIYALPFVSVGVADSYDNGSPKWKDLLDEGKLNISSSVSSANKLKSKDQSSCNHKGKTTHNVDGQSHRSNKSVSSETKTNASIESQHLNYSEGLPTGREFVTKDNSINSTKIIASADTLIHESKKRSLPKIEANVSINAASPFSNKTSKTKDPIPRIQTPLMLNLTKLLQFRKTSSNSFVRSYVNQSTEIHFNHRISDSAKTEQIKTLATQIVSPKSYKVSLLEKLVNSLPKITESTRQELSKILRRILKRKEKPPNVFENRRKINFVTKPDSTLNANTFTTDAQYQRDSNSSQQTSSYKINSDTNVHLSLNASSILNGEETILDNVDRSSVPTTMALIDSEEDNATPDSTESVLETSTPTIYDGVYANGDLDDRAPAKVTNNFNDRHDEEDGDFDDDAVEDINTNEHQESIVEIPNMTGMPSSEPNIRSSDDKETLFITGNNSPVSESSDHVYNETQNERIPSFIDSRKTSNESGFQKQDIRDNNNTINDTRQETHSLSVQLSRRIQEQIDKIKLLEKQIQQARNIISNADTQSESVVDSLRDSITNSQHQPDDSDEDKRTSNDENDDAPVSTIIVSKKASNNETRSVKSYSEIPKHGNLINTTAASPIMIDSLSTTTQSALSSKPLESTNVSSQLANEEHVVEQNIPLTDQPDPINNTSDNPVGGTTSENPDPVLGSTPDTSHDKSTIIPQPYTVSKERRKLLEHQLFFEGFYVHPTDEKEKIQQEQQPNLDVPAQPEQALIAQFSGLVKTINKETLMSDKVGVDNIGTNQSLYIQNETGDFLQGTSESDANMTNKELYDSITTYPTYDDIDGTDDETIVTDEFNDTGLTVFNDQEEEILSDDEFPEEVRTFSFSILPESSRKSGSFWKKVFAKRN